MADCLFYLVNLYINLLLKGEFAVVPTGKICGRSLSVKIPVDMHSIFIKLYGTCPRDQGHTPQKFEVIFVGFRLMKNIIYN